MSDVAAWIERHAAATPDKAALIQDGQTLTYAALAARVRQLAAYLMHEQGLGPGARVAWLGHNVPDLLALLFACARAGLVLVPLNWRLGDVEIADIVADAGVSLALLDVSCRERCPALAVTRIVTRGFALPSLAVLPENDADADRPAARGGPALPLLLVYTSGTTGQPKGAVLTQAALQFNTLNAVHMHDLGAGDVVLTVLPLFHVGGLNIQTVPALYCGATVVLEPRFDAGRTLALIERWRPTLSVQVPATLTALLEQPAWAATDLTCLRCITTGSTDVPRSLIETLHARGVPVIQIYGATETGPVAIYQRLEEAFSTAGSIGRAGLHTEIELRAGDGRPLGPGEPGEIYVRGPHLASGYWDRARQGVTLFADGWFASGDVAERDPAGYYWFKDRKKHVIISGGENIYPAEIERILHASGLLREAAVAGRADPRWGEVPVVVAVRAQSAVDKAAVLSLFDGALARYKHPRDVVFTDALPRNALGKVEVQRLRELVRT